MFASSRWRLKSSVASRFTLHVLRSTGRHADSSLTRVNFRPHELAVKFSATHTSPRRAGKDHSVGNSSPHLREVGNAQQLSISMRGHDRPFLRRVLRGRRDSRTRRAHGVEQRCVERPAHISPRAASDTACRHCGVAARLAAREHIQTRMLATCGCPRAARGSAS